MQKKIVMHFALQDAAQNSQALKNQAGAWFLFTSIFQVCLQSAFKMHHRADRLACMH